MLLEKGVAMKKSWMILYIAYTIMKAVESQSLTNEKDLLLNNQLIETTIIELSKSVLKLNNGRWD